MMPLRLRTGHHRWQVTQNGVEAMQPEVESAIQANQMAFRNPLPKCLPIRWAPRQNQVVGVWAS